MSDPGSRSINNESMISQGVRVIDNESTSTHKGPQRKSRMVYRQLSANHCESEIKTACVAEFLARVYP